MKQSISFLFLVFLLSCSPTEHVTVEPVEVKIITGQCEREIFVSESEFKEWFDSRYAEYSVNDTLISTIDSLSTNTSFIVFLGTWCGDSKREIPHFFKLLDEAGISDSVVSMYGLDRSKVSNDGLTEKYGITKVPTIIVLRQGQELGRIVEQPNESLEKDLVKILSQRSITE